MSGDVRWAGRVRERFGVLVGGFRFRGTFVLCRGVFRVFCIFFVLGVLYEGFILVFKLVVV